MGVETGRSSGDAPSRLVIVDDHDLLRAGLRDVLADPPDVEVIGEAANGREALVLCRDAKPDLILMDIRMPVMDGIEATRAIKREHPKIVVLMITMYENPDYLFEAIKAGAAGYVLKNSPREELISAVRRALSGDSPLDQGLAAKLLRRMAHEGQERKKRSADEPLPPQEVHAAPRRPQEPLTPRELEVLKLVAPGKTNRQIAEELFLSANTIKVHVQHLIAKLGVSDRTQAATLAVQMGLLSSET